MSGNPLKWLRDKLAFFLGNDPVPQPQVKGAAEVIINQARFDLQDLALRRSQGAIDNTAFEMGARRAIKNLHIANGALAHGGWSQMSPADYKRLEPIIEREYQFFDGRMADLRAGRYGRDQLNGSFLNHVSQYADAGRSTYENEYLRVNQDAGRTEAMRVLATAQNCEDCLAWAGVWYPIDDVPLIGDSVCHGSCHCVMQYR